MNSFVLGFMINVILAYPYFAFFCPTRLDVLFLYPTLDLHMTAGHRSCLIVGLDVFPILTNFNVTMPL